MTITVSEDMTTDESPPAVCTIQGCGRPRVAKGLCTLHYGRVRRTGTTDAPVRKNANNKGHECSVQGCGNEARALGMCEMHYTRYRLTGDVGPAEPKGPIPLYERAMRMVDDSAGPEACHPWTGQEKKGVPVISDGPRGHRTLRSVRRVIAHEHGLLADMSDQRQWIKARPECDRLCCNIKHLRSTGEGRPGTRKEA